MKFSGITLVTGAAGFMGSHVVEHIVKKGIRVRATARARKDVSFFEKLGVEYVAADLTKPDTLPQLFAGDVDRVFHLGAICDFSTPYSKLYPTNVAGVGHITKLALEKKVKSFVHVTSTSVYGYYSGTAYKETDKRHPENDYGKSKAEGENIVFHRITEGLPAVIIRPCTVYGPRCNDGAGKAFSRPTSISAIPGSGKQLLSNVRAEDVATALEHLSLKQGIIGQVFNIAENSNPTLEQALVMAAKTYQTKIPILHLPLSLVKIISLIDGFISGLKGKIPDLEYEAVKYLYYDYVVDNKKLEDSGFKLQNPDFMASMKQLGKLYKP
ncbi:MAG: nucleoside-diphosphate sugar epimerase [Desulfobacteraceae bacterium 4572_123]|nr:MAG: nucleoside-diphosphate sugar epimerase [Desulfobacteraceae bacterium 4572_123]